MSAGAGEDLVGVAFAADLGKGEMIRGLLESAGIRSVLQPIGIDGPGLGIDWLNPGRGSRRVMVRASQFEEAQALLERALAEGTRLDLPEPVNARYLEEDEGPGARSYGVVGAHIRIWAWSFGAMGLAFAVFVLLRLL